MPGPFPFRSNVFKIYNPTAASSTKSSMTSEKCNFENIFSSENKERTLHKLTNVKCESFIEHVVGNVMRRKAAILVPLCYDLNDRPALLLNVRSKSLRSHQGQICFPGGQLDPEDHNNVVTAALRETEEELGIKRSNVDVWGILPFVPTVTSLMRVAPVLGFIKKPVDAKILKLNTAEVEFAFTVPIEHLCDPKNWGNTNLSKNGYFSKFTSFPSFVNLDDYMGGEKIRLWGLTAIVTHMVLSCLVPEAYQREVPISSRIIQEPESKL